MYLDYTPEQQALRRELRAYFGRLVTPEYQAELSRSEGGGPLYMQAVRKLGADGWLGIGWPTEYGGQGRSPIEQFIFFDEAARAGVMLPTLTINAVVTFYETRLEAEGQFALRQTEYGIQPVSVAGGTIKVKDELKFSFNIVANR